MGKTNAKLGPVVAIVGGAKRAAAVSSSKDVAVAKDGESNDRRIGQTGIDLAPVVASIVGAKYAPPSPGKDVAVAIDAKSTDRSTG